MTTTQTNPATPQPPLLEISTARAIALARRWRWLSIVLRVAMVFILAAAIYAYERGGGFMVVVAMFVLWTVIASLSARTRQLAFDAGQHFAAGEFDLAEDRITQSLKSFSLVSSTKHMVLQQLAMLRHAQNRWADAAVLARAFLAGRPRVDPRAAIGSRLVLAESLLEMGQLQSVARELHELSFPRLNLRETLTLTQLRLDFLSRQGDFGSMFATPGATVSLIELMPAPVAARCHAMLALAARKLGRADWHHWLAERAKLLADEGSILETRPHLRDAFGA
jgi:hypothetical protein